MRIDLQSAYVANLNDSQKTSAKTTQPQEPELIGADASSNVQLSKVGTQATEPPDIRQDRVAQLRQAIESGTYSVSNEALAGAIMRNLLQH